MTKLTVRCKTMASYFKVSEAHTSISGGHAVALSPPWTRHSEQKRVGLHHVAVTGFKLLAGHDQCGESSQLGLTAVWVQRHLLFTCRHLLYRTTYILEKQKWNMSSKHLLAYGSFPPSGTGQYSTGPEHPDPACVSTANSTLYLIGVVYTGK